MSDEIKLLVPEEKTSKLEKAALGVAVTGGAATSIGWVVAAGTATTGAISAAGSAIGAIGGAVLVSGVGLATGGFGMAATVPFATAGAAIGAWTGPALAVLVIGTAPAWAVPAAIGGGIIATGGIAIAGYKLMKARSRK